MKLKKISLVILTLVVLLVGGAAATPLTVGGGWTWYGMPSATSLPISSNSNPFTYTSPVATHILLTDAQCIGDQPAIFDANDVMLGAGNPVAIDYACSPRIEDGDVNYAGGWSHACIDMPASPTGAVTTFYIKNIVSWGMAYTDGGYVKVVEGPCPGTIPSPEFPSMALPICMIIGVMLVVYTLRTGRKE